MNRYVLACCLLIAGAVSPMVPGTQPGDIQLEVISVKVMSDKERTKIAGPDFIGGDVLVRLRLSAASREMSFYAAKFNKEPIGHRTKWSGDGQMQVYQIGAKEAKEVSPGIDDMGRVGLPTAWFPLAAGKTVEWEILDDTGDAGHKHGTSVFIKLLPDEAPVEIFSAPYVVPAAAVRTRR
jgi:hypothetical protein